MAETVWRSLKPNSRARSSWDFPCCSLSALILLPIFGDIEGSPPTIYHDLQDFIATAQKLVVGSFDQNSPTQKVNGPRYQHKFVTEKTVIGLLLFRNADQLWAIERQFRNT